MPLATLPKCYLDALCVRHDMTVDQWIEESLQIDLDGLEFYYGFTDQNDATQWERWRRRVEATGRSIPMFCSSPDFTKPEYADRKSEVERQRGFIRAAAALGAKYCRVLSGQRRPEVPRAQGLAWARECILELIPFAASHGIILNLENHYKDTYWEFPEFAQSMDDFLELVDGIPETPWFGINYDPSNAIIAGDDPIALLERIRHRVVSMHASDRYFEGGTAADLRRLESHPQTGYAHFLKHGVIGCGMNDYDRIFTILHAAGFQGWISIEDGPDEKTGLRDLIESAQFVRRKMIEHGLH